MQQQPQDNKENEGTRGARTVIVPRMENGFGFTLRHFIVYPPKGSQTDLQDDRSTDGESDSSGGKRSKLSSLEPMDTIFVKHVKDGGPAQHAGLHTGDRILSVNSQSVAGKTYSQVVALIQSSDKSLKLLVVPKDEDVLQMTYEASAYNRGQEPFKGRAQNIPEPPRGEEIQEPEGGNVLTKPPMAQGKYKAEVKFQPARGLRHRTGSDPTMQPIQTSRPPLVAGSLQSVASGVRSGMGPNYDGHPNVQYMDEHDGAPQGLYGYNSPMVGQSSPYRGQARTTAFHVLKGPEGRHAGSMDSISRSSDNSTQSRGSHVSSGSHHSRDSRDSVGSGSGQMNVPKPKEIARVYPYCKERHSDPSVFSDFHPSQRQSLEGIREKTQKLQQTRPHSSMHGANSVAPYRSTSTTAMSSVYVPASGASVEQKATSVSPYIPQSRMFTSLAYIPPTTSWPRDSHPQSYPSPVSAGSQGPSPSLLRSQSGDIAPSPIHYPHEQSRRMSEDSQPGNVRHGPHIRVKVADGSGVHINIPSSEYGGTDAQITISAGRGKPHPNFSIVSSRAKLFEKGEASKSALQKRADHTRFAQPTPSRGESVSLRTAQFESLEVEDASDEETKNKKVRIEVRTKPTSQSPLAGYPAGHAMVTSTGPQSHSSMDMVYETPPPKTPTVQLQQAPFEQAELMTPMPYADGQSYTDSVSSDGTSIRDRSPLTPDDSPPSPRTTQGVSRQPSYLRAIHSPKAKFLHMPEVAATVTTATTTTTTVSSSDIVLRQPPEDEQEMRLQRRTSYLMATGTERPRVTKVQITEPNQGTPTTVSSQGEPFTVDRPVLLDLPLTPGQSQETESTGDSPYDATPATPPARVSIKKLKAFFGEKTPRIVEATRDKTQVYDLPSPIGMGDAIKEGMLNYKISFMDGKRASDRSWKPVWGVLRGHALYLYKEKSSATTNPFFSDEQPISIKNSVVDIAYKYAKRKNVFQLSTYNGSEYLFQAEDNQAMLSWIQTIRHNCNPDADEKGGVSEELILRKTSEVEQAFKSLPPPPSKPQKKANVKVIKTKAPVTHSPGMKQRKTSEKDLSEASKSKDRADNKTWRGRVAKKFKRYGSSSSSQTEVTGTFCVPLELCPQSSFSEFVPLVVELCTTIVEARGMEMTGIYRVPGNTGSINMLQEELNKGVDNLDMENDKWLDVNVVGSLLKSFFRKLPDPLVTEELYVQFISANREDNPEKRMLKIKKLLHDLPEHNFETFHYLAEHLHKVASMGDVNKMDARNLAIVFGPTLVRTFDDSMVTMVKDMSDQCRIVESIILHPDWFFSSWDVDSWVPVDEDTENAAPVSSINQELLSKAENLELGERGREISARELVSSIISAANRKKKRKDKLKSGDGVSVDVDPPSDIQYNERDIDREIELRRVKEPERNLSTPTIEEKEVSPSRAAEVHHAQTRDGIYSARMTFLLNHPERKSPLPTPPLMTKSDANVNANDGVQVKRYPAYSPSAETHFCTENAKPVYRRLSEDMLNESKGSGHSYSMNQSAGGSPWSDSSSLQRSQTDIDEYLRGTPQRGSPAQVPYRGYTPDKHTPGRNHSDDVMMQSMDSSSNLMGRSPEFTRRTDTMSTTSDYSTMSSRNSSQDQRQSLQVAPSPTTATNTTPSTSPSTSFTASLRPSRGVIPKSQSAEWRKCTISEGGKYFVMSSAGDAPSKYIAKDDTELCKSQGGKNFDVHKVVGKGTLQRRSRDRSVSNEGESPIDKREFRRSGSLDSLLDLSQEQAGMSPTNRSGEEDDLMSSITSTFDKKLKFLLDSSSTQYDPTAWPPNKPELQSSILRDQQGRAKSERPFKSPSLHKEEPVVGIASRIERTDITSDQLNRERKSRSVNDKRSPAEGHHEMRQSEYAAAVRNTTEKMFGSKELLYGSTEKLLEEQSSVTRAVPKSHGLRIMGDKACSSSPPVRRKDPAVNKVRRRHTVGGTNDLENFKALMAVNQQAKSTETKSAWERLQPAVKKDTQDVQSWLQQRQQLRGAGSSPAILLPSLQYRSPTRNRDAANLRSRRAVSAIASAAPLHSNSEPTSPGAGNQHPFVQRFSFESSI